VVGKVPIHVRHELLEARNHGNGVRLKFRNGSDAIRTADVDFVIAGTGYEVDVARLTYLDADVRGQIKCIERSPELSIHFESSVPGLYFAGPLSFMCFGPMFRFVSGAEVAARKLARRLS
jgi:thioredoxin reductase